MQGLWNHRSARRIRLTLALLLVASMATIGSLPAHAATNTFKQTNLVADIEGKAVTTDPNLVNPWGISHSATSPFWVSDNGTGVSTLYNGAGMKQLLVVTIPPPAGSPPDTTATPTGQVFNSTVAFTVTNGTKSAPSRFIFAT